MDTGSSAFILICSAMVCLMTPALAFFYGGLGRRKNVINTMMMSVLPLAIASLLWIVAGYSLSFGGHGNIFGNFSHLFLNGVSETASSRGLTIPDMLFAAFQMMFSIICVAILTGSVVGRMRFTPLAIFVVFWLLLVYYPFAHMVWDEGLLAKWGTIDFAGGDVVHITSGVSALVLAIVVGKRRDFGILEHRPHNVPFVLLGAGLLWFGWFGFNAGSALAANGLAKGMTVSQVLGYGNQRGFAEFVRGQRIVPTLLAKVKVEIVVKDMAVDEVVDAIRSAVATGEVGDGKIFIVPIDDVIRIRTGERDGDAI